jgi:hypothetical protein
LDGRHWVLTVARDAATDYLTAQIQATGNPEFLADCGKEELRGSMEVDLMEVTGDDPSEVTLAVLCSC